MSASMPTGRILQVNVSPGGVPKLPVERAWVGRFGVEGDGHHEPTVHGGPFRAVCLFGIEVIERLRAEGHPLGPGSVGENLTTAGIEWSTLPSGTRARIGDSLELELWLPALPCNTQRPNFIDGRFGRISPVAHPGDSRMYASVVVEGEVRPGDPITLLPPEPESEATRAALFVGIDTVEQESLLRLWRAARAAGLDVRILDDGEISAAAAPSIPGPAFNRAAGLRQFPNMLDLVTGHFRKHGVSGWLPMQDPPWPGAEPDHRLAVLWGATIGVRRDARPPAGVTIRELGPSEADTWADVFEADAAAAARDGVGRALAPHLLGMRGVSVVVAEEEGRPVGAGSVHIQRSTALLRAGVVVPSARGRGIHRALIAARAQLAFDAGCDTVTAQVEPGSAAERSLLGVGLETLAVRDVYRWDPPASEAGAG